MNPMPDEPHEQLPDVSQQQLIDYIRRATIGLFWHCDDVGETFTWRDDTTMIFTEQLLHVLQPWVNTGLPPWAPLILLLGISGRSAAGDNVKQVARFVSERLPQLSMLDRRRLWRLATLLVPAHDALRSSVGKTRLVQLVFAHVPPDCTREIGARFCALLETHPQYVAYLARPRFAESTATVTTHEHAAAEALRVLDKATQDLTPESLTRLLATGLDQDIEPASLEFPRAADIRMLLHCLERDHDLPGLAHLTRQVLAALRLPHRTAHANTLPLGGVADIHTRGEFDKLLLSEWAYDDLSFTARIATREALFLRYESPARRQTSGRIVLIDTSVPMWGTPRVFALAVALAIVAISREPTRVYRATPDGPRPVDLSTPAGLLEQLAALTPTLHPGDCLEPFLALAADSAMTDVVLISCDEVLQDPDFANKLTSIGGEMFIAQVDRRGGFHLDHRVAEGPPRRIGQAQLDLSQISPRTLKRNQAGAQHQIDKSAPWHQQQLPICLPLPPPVRESLSRETWFVEDHGWYFITRDGLLLHRPIGRRHPTIIQLAAELPPRSQIVWGSRFVEEEHVQLVIQGPHHRCHLTIDRQNQTVQRVVHAAPDVAGTVYAEHDGYLFMINGRQVKVVARESGKLRSDVVLDDNVHHCWGRYFRRKTNPPGHASTIGNRHTNEILALSCEQGHAVWTPISITTNLASDVAEELRGQDIIYLLDRPDCEGPLALMQGLQLLETGTSRIATAFRDKLPPAIVPHVYRTSRCGRVVAFHIGHRGFSINLATSSVARCPEPIDIHLERTANCVESLRPLEWQSPVVRTRWRAVIVDGRGNLVLQAWHQRTYWRIDLVDDVILLVKHDMADQAWKVRYPFRSLPRRYKQGLRIDEVWTQDGSRIVIDARGLLYLQSPRASVLTVSLLLVGDHPIPGWLADGRCWGTESFCQADPECSPREAFQLAVAPFARGLR